MLKCYVTFLNKIVVVKCKINEEEKVLLNKNKMRLK